VKKKHKLYKRYLHSNASHDYRAYIQHRNNCNREIKKAKRVFERKFFKTARQIINNSGDIFKVRQNLLLASVL
jgi:hypothetical protein